MRLAETVTFGGSGLDRAAEARRGPAFTAICAEAGARTICLWRGKPLVEAGALVQLPPDHAIFDGAPPPMLLGRDDQGPVLARDLSHWTPEAGPAPEPGFFDPTEQCHPALPEAQRFCELRGQMTALSPRDAELAATARALLNWHRTHRFCAACGAPSEVADAGWRRDCPTCGAQHFPRTDPVVIMLITHGEEVLLGRNAAWPEGMYSLLAGFVEPGETLEAAVRREVAEEAGIAVGRVGYLASQPWPFPNSLMIGCEGEALSREITLDPEELEEALWVSRDEMLEVFAGTHPRIKPAREGAIAHFLLRNWLADRLD